MIKTFKFNGEIKPWLYLLQGRKKALFPGINRTTVEVPGMHGAHLTSHRMEPLVISVPVAFLVENESHELSLKDELASWLYTADPAPLEFVDDEPGRIYYAVVQNTIDDIERAFKARKGTITFLCADPFGYGESRRTSLMAGGTTTIANEGTADAYPVFDLTVKEDSTHIEIGNQSNLTRGGTGRSIVLGDLQEVGTEPVEDKTLVLHDTMKSTAGWQGATSVDSGYVSGQMGVESDGFYVEQWGDEGHEGPPKNDWIGPSLQRALPKPLKSFVADAYISNRNATDDTGAGLLGVVGIIEVYMRDANGNTVCKLQFGDTFDNATMNKAVFASAGQQRVYRGDPPIQWNDFDGVIRIVRDTESFYPYIAQIDKNGRHRVICEPDAIAPGPTVGNNEVTTIQIAMRKWVGARRMTMRIKEIKVYSIIGMYEYPDYTPRLSFKAGDRLQIDTAKALVLLNGEPRNDVINLDTDFFSLVEGLNRLTLSDNVDGSVSYRNRHL